MPETTSAIPVVKINGQLKSKVSSLRKGARCTLQRKLRLSRGGKPLVRNFFIPGGSAECGWGGSIIVEKVFQSCIIAGLWGCKTRKNSFVFSAVEW
jgi:hypothetical protein